MTTLSPTRCPRCIGGNMRRDQYGEEFCLQCGHTPKPALVMDKPIVIPPVGGRRTVPASRRR